MKKNLFAIGVDVSKEKLDVYFHSSGFHFIVPNNTQGFAELIESIMLNAGCSLKDVLICFENTGKYSKQLSVFLEESDIKFFMSPALAIKRSLGLVRGKDDKIDAKRIALYAYEKRETLPLTKLPGPKIDQIKSLLTLRDKLMRHRTSYKNGISDLKDCYQEGETGFIRETQENLIELLSLKIEEVDDKIMEIINRDTEMIKNYQLMNSIKGVGKITAIYFIAYTENFKAFSNAKQFACYCGIAPFPYSSGKMIGKTKVHAFGNKKMKSILDLVAKSTIRYNNEFQAYYVRRVNELGKSKMSTINIIRNKIVSRVFAVISRETPYVDLHKFAA
jgi:transposase